MLGTGMSLGLSFSSQYIFDINQMKKLKRRFWGLSQTVCENFFSLFDKRIINRFIFILNYECCN